MKSLAPTLFQKKCIKCLRPVESITTDGRDLYIDGEKMPDKLIKAILPCPHCSKGMVVWVRERVSDEARVSS